MSRIHRAFTSNLPDVGETMDLGGTEAHHLGRVLRVRVGERVVLFDGLGKAVSTEVAGVSKRVVQLRVLAEEPQPPPPPVRLRLAVGFPDRKRAQRMVEALSELGVQELVPLVCERGASSPPRETLERWALESAKQSGRNALLHLGDPLPLSALELAADEEGWVADPEAEGWFADRLRLPPPSALLVAVGPPGGFTPEERDGLLARGFQAWRLAPGVLRVETAAVSAAACAVAGWPPRRGDGPDA